MRAEIVYSLRTIWREPGFTFVLVLGLALGIGANTAIFSVVDAVLLSPLAYPEPDRLFMVGEVIPKVSRLYPRLPANLGHFYQWRKQCSSFEGISASQAFTVNFTGGDQPEVLKAARVSANLFQVLGAEPRLGRTFLEEEDQQGRDDVVILTDSLWRRRFNADPAAVGRKANFDGHPYLVVGVMPPGFRLPRQGPTRSVSLSEKTELFKPLGYTAEDLRSVVGDFNYYVIARLRTGVSPQQALSELNVVQASISKTLPEPLDLRGSLTPLQEEMVEGVRSGLLVIMAAVGAVLVVLCVNLANLSLVRAAGRARAFAIRAALGASGWRIARQMLIESVVLSLAGGVLGIGLAHWGVRLLLRTAPLDLPRLADVGVDARVLGFALLLALTTGLVFGTLPAFRSASAEPYLDLKSGGHTTTEGVRGVRLRHTLVACEVGISAVLLVTAGLLIGSFVRLMNVDKGFDIERVLVLSLALPSSQYSEGAQRAAFFERVLLKSENLPGAISAGLVSSLPFQGETWIDVVSTPEDQRPILERPKVNTRFVSPAYFKTLQVPLQQGRTFTEADRQKEVAIVSRTVAENLWPGRSAIGRQMLHNDTPVEIVGVTNDIRSTNLEKEPSLMLYIPYWQRSRLNANLLVRTSMDPYSLAAAVRAAVWEINPEVPISEMKTLREVMAESVAQRRFQMVLVIIFAGSALALAGLGTYGVVSYSVERRRSELGIRLALGADAGAVQRMVLRQGLMPVAVGLAIGIAAALVTGRFLQDLLFQVNAKDPWTIGTVAVVLLLVAAAACALPARRATRVDPVSSLRAE